MHAACVNLDRGNNPVDPNPFRSSGMLLAANGALPAKRDLFLGEPTEASCPRS
jgi:hypothetical protein